MILNITIICTESTCANYKSRQKNEKLTHTHTPAVSQSG